MIDILRQISFSKSPTSNDTVLPLVLLSIRFMIERKFNSEKPFGINDSTLGKTYMEYLSQIKFDDLSHWTEDQLAFYNRRSFQVNKDTSR